MDSGKILRFRTVKQKINNSLLWTIGGPDQRNPVCTPRFECYLAVKVTFIHLYILVLLQ